MQLRLHLIALALIIAPLAFSDEQTSWAQLAQNPMADLLMLPIENHFDAGTGHKDATTYRLNLKPTMPSDFNKDLILINRLDIPFFYQPGRVQGEKDSFGLGDTTYESFLGPSGDRTFYWGVGPAFQVPTATDNQLGSKKWSAGLSGTGTWVKGPVVAGIRANHLWSFAGDDDRPDIDLSTLEYFAYFNFGNGWWIGTSPVNTANWEADSSETWTIPIGGGIGKIIMKGRLPIQFSLEAYDHVESPANTADWSVACNIQFLFPDEIFFKR